MKAYGLFYPVIGFCLILISATTALERPAKMIIDTDAGGDDAFAILLALAAEDEAKNNNFEIVAITCTYGNTKLTNVELNVLKTLTIGNRSDIPVYAGVSKPLMRNFTLDNFFGKDGFGDFDFGEPVLGKINKSMHASVAMVELARKYAGSISILAIGPLTNIALAINLDSNFVNNVHRFYIMGSSVHGLGNAAPNVEFNFSQDPHSNFIALNSTRGFPAVIFPWETCFAAAIPMEWRKDVLGASNTTTMKFINNAERKSLTSNTWTAADVMLTALALWPNLITRTILTNLTPVFDGSAQGTALIDYNNVTDKPHNVEILDKFNVEGFQELLLETFT